MFLISDFDYILIFFISKLAGPVLTGTHFYILIFSVPPLLTCWQYFATQELKHQHLGY